MGTDRGRWIARPQRILMGTACLALLVLGSGCSDSDDDAETATTPTSRAEPATSAATDPGPATTGGGSPDTGATDPVATTSTAPATTGTAPPAAPPVAPPPPTLLGVPGEFGMEYPNPTTCDEAGAVVATLDLDVVAAVSQGDGSFIWLAVDETSVSADLFSDVAPDRTLIRIRAGSIDFAGEPTIDDLPALGSDVSYAVTTIAPDGSVTDCVEGPVVG